MPTNSNACTCGSCAGHKCTCGCQNAKVERRTGCRCGEVCNCAPGCGCKQS